MSQNSLQKSPKTVHKIAQNTIPKVAQNSEKPNPNFFGFTWFVVLV